MQYKVPVAMDSDAHVDNAVGEHGYALEVLEKVGFPEELLVNAHPEILKDYINYYLFTS